MDETEKIPYASPKRKMTLMIVKHLSMHSQKEKVKMNLMKRYIKNGSLKLKTAVEIEKQAVEDKKKFIKREFEQKKVDIKFQKNQILKKYRTFLTRSKKKNQ